jgi:rhodanese-related sulfurtransferase
MKKIFCSLFIFSLISIYSTGCGSAKNKENPITKNGVVFACLPCGAGCDTMVYQKPGSCSHCSMELVDKSTIIHKNIQPEEMCTLDTGNVMFLDVRTPEEFNGSAKEKFGAIRNAININVEELQARISELEKYKEREIVVYCSHSHRSPRASYMLTQAGFKNVTNMKGGMSVWNERVTPNECNSKLYLQQ